MIAYPFASLLAGLALCGAAICTLWRTSLLEPESTKYPKAPLWLRNTMFGFAAIVMFLGLQFLWVFVSGKPDTIPPQPSSSMQLMSIALLVHQGALLLNILRQRYPAEVWDRLHKINDRLFCKDVKHTSLWQWLSW